MMAVTSHDVQESGTAGAPSALAPLTEARVEEQTDSGSFSRGKSYYRKGYIFDTIRRENTLRAQSHGSSGGPYTVEATLAPANVASAFNPIAYACNCPRGGFCKHVVALLLTWINEPEQFAERPTIAAQLAERSRADLVTLVEMMLKRHPDLELLLDMPLAVPTAGASARSGAAAEQTVDAAAVRRQVIAAYRHVTSDDWHAARTIAGELDALLQLGDNYANTGHWANARIVFDTIVDEVITRYSDLLNDENGNLLAVIVHCDNRLSECLAIQDDLDAADRLGQDARERIIKVLYDIWRFDSIERGSIGLATEGPDVIARHGTDAERELVSGWLREEIQSGDDFMVQWTNRAVAGFQVMLKEESGLTDEELLEVYRDAELWEDIAATLLRLGREDEAISLAGRKLTVPHQLTAFADKVLALGGDRVRQGLTLVDDRLWETEGVNQHHDSLLLQWLADCYAAHGMPREALETARRRFAQRPGPDTYEAVKTAAQLPSQANETWAKLRPQLIAELRKQDAWSTLITIYLSEGDIKDAISALAKAEKASRPSAHASSFGYVAGFWGLPSQQLAVAEAAEREFPDDAIRLYRRLADRLIDQRQRPSYRAAAEYLARVKRLMEAQGDAESWQTSINNLREQHKRLRALREELDALGLK